MQTVEGPTRKSKPLNSIRVVAGVVAKERQKQRFLELAEQLSKSSSRIKQKRIKTELARLTFGT